MDVVGTGERVGCADLRRYVETIKPKVHIFGHIHECYGMEQKDNTLFVNASTCTGNYRPTNPPIVVDI
jgi:Icc-related predicted phosphoesterase